MVCDNFLGVVEISLKLCDPEVARVTRQLGGCDNPVPCEAHPMLFGVSRSVSQGGLADAAGGVFDRHGCGVGTKHHIDNASQGQVGACPQKACGLGRGQSAA